MNIHSRLERAQKRAQAAVDRTAEALAKQMYRDCTPEEIAALIAELEEDIARTDPRRLRRLCGDR